MIFDEYMIKIELYRLPHAFCVYANALLQVNTLLHLMKKGVDMTSKDDEGLTPLDIAKENRNEECIRLLFKAQKPEVLVS